MASPRPLPPNSGHLISFSSMPLLLFIIIIVTMITFTIGITSNTVLISIMLPILCKVAEQTEVSTTLIILVATICASYAFMLLIVNSSNVIAMSSDVIKIKIMAAYGSIFNIIGIILIVTVSNFFWINVF